MYLQGVVIIPNDYSYNSEMKKVIRSTEELDRIRYNKKYNVNLSFDKKDYIVFTAYGTTTEPHHVDKVDIINGNAKVVIVRTKNKNTAFFGIDSYLYFVPIDKGTTINSISIESTSIPTLGY